MKRIILTGENVELLKEGKLKKIYLPLVEKKDDQGRTFREVC